MADKTHGWVKLYRSIKQWEWYKNGPCRSLMINLLVSVTWKKYRVSGHTIHPGEYLTTQRKLAEECLLTRQQLRTATSRLRTTGEISTRVITIDTTNGKTTNVSVYRIEKFAEFQIMELAETTPITNDTTTLPTSGQPSVNPITRINNNYNKPPNPPASEAAEKAEGGFMENLNKIWEAYPANYRGDGEAAVAAMEKIIAAGKITVDGLGQAVAGYANSQRVAAGYGTNCLTWIKNGGYLDTYPQQPAPPKIKTPEEFKQERKQRFPPWFAEFFEQADTADLDAFPGLARCLEGSRLDAKTLYLLGDANFTPVLMRLDAMEKIMGFRPGLKIYYPKGYGEQYKRYKEYQ